MNNRCIYQLSAYTVNPLYNDHVCSKLSLMLKWICCYNEMRTSTRFPHNHLIKENIVHMNLNAIIPSIYISSISYCMKITKVPLLSNVTETYSCKRQYISWSPNGLTHRKNSVIMNIFSIENVYLFPELTVGVVKWIFCYKEGILMEIDPSPAILCRIVNILL